MNAEDRQAQARLESAETVKALAALGVSGPFDLGMVLGTGLGPLADEIENAVRVPYSAIPGFPAGNVSGHAKQLVAGTLAGKRVVAYNGRSHYYEKGDSGVMRLPVATLAGLQCKAVLLTNAAGSLDEKLGPGSISLITDHINYSGRDPLIGDPDDARFVSLTDAYDPALCKLMKAAAKAEKVKLGKGVYVWFSGPSFETPAEIRMARIIGGSIVGMSTVPEVILAKRFGLTVVAMSMLTNLAAGIQGSSPTHDETKAVAAIGGADMRRVVRNFVGRL
ncbi:MAG: purine-nucleoside phosphorylase [Beijerinckiaceae bacterium]